MSGFPLLQLNPSNFEKVINKLKEKSYFRIQQTCHTVHDFIHTSPNISVHVDHSVYLRVDGDNSCYMMDHLNARVRNLGIESIYGTCFPSINFLENDIDILCDALTKYRITAKKSEISQYKWDFEECVKILNALKCRDVDIMSSRLCPYEAFFESKYVKKVHIYVDGDEKFAEMAPDILPKFEEVKFHVGDPDACALDLLRIYMENLIPVLVGNLKLFRLEATWQHHLKVPQLQELLSDKFNMKIAATVYDKANDKRTITIELPQSFPPNASLVIDIEEVFTCMTMFITYRS